MLVFEVRMGVLRELRELITGIDFRNPCKTYTLNTKHFILAVYITYWKPLKCQHLINCVDIDHGLYM